MFLPQLGQELSGRPGAPCSHIRVTFLDALHGFFEVLPFPFEIGGHCLVESGGWVLAASLRVFFQLSLAERRERYGIHVVHLLSFPPS
jgi:hypothetical protein